MSKLSEVEARRLGRIYAISQIGMEMAIPVGVGVGLDFWLGILPWCTIIGAILGPTLGVIHLISLLNPPPETPVDTKK